jgi:hypothetical protein
MTAKTDLLGILASKNRGLTASDSEKQSINIRTGGWFDFYGVHGKVVGKRS